ncbi:MAG: nucleotidyltransferase family protein, partial [Myxococcota bacterium]|nr:nucleotidyltransferase family protein [Myxococcota bacterium]
MQVSEDTFELGKAIGQLLRGDARGAKALLVWNPEQLAQRLEIERLGGHIDQLLRSVAADAYIGSAQEAALAPLVSAMQFDWIRREEALSQLIKVFEENGIRAAFLKGIVWSDIVYQRPFDRSASDIDILISERDALHFHQVMQRAGYRYRDDKNTFASNEFAYHPRDDAYPFEIDVHWSLCDLYA